MASGDLKQAIADAAAVVPMPGEESTREYDRALEKLCGLLRAVEPSTPVYSDLQLERRERHRHVSASGLLDEFAEIDRLWEAGEEVCYAERRLIMAYLRAQPEGLTERQCTILMRWFDGFSQRAISGFCAFRATETDRPELIASPRTVGRELVKLLPRAELYPYFGLITLLTKLFVGKG